MRALQGIVIAIGVAVIGAAAVSLIADYLPNLELGLWIALVAGVLLVVVGLLFLHGDTEEVKTAMYDVDELEDAQLEDEFTTAETFLRGRTIRGLRTKGNIHLPRWKRRNVEKPKEEE